MDMKTYNVCNMPDEELFFKQCEALESRIPDLVKGKLLEDADGSKTQIYTKNGQTMSVHNSMYINALYIQSDFEIEEYF